MNKTAIEWVKNPDGSQGYTWNPLTGCLNHTPEGLCLGGMFPCYAYKLANGRLRQRYLANENTIMRFSDGYAPMKLKVTDPFYPRYWPERLTNIPEDWMTLAGVQKVKPRGIFVCDMGELFGDWIPKEWQSRIFTKFIQCPQHRFYLLTKQPQNLPQWSPFPDHCYVGVTATDTAMFQIATAYLANIEARVKYISLEPLLSWEMGSDCMAGYLQERGIQWVIIGAQTKPTVYPKIEWVEEIVRACDKAGVPVFLKDNLKPLLETLDITRTSFGRLTSLTIEAIKDTQGLPRQRGWYELRQELPK